MCLAVPMELVELTEDRRGVADLSGARYEVDLSLLEKAKKGDFVIVHAGFAIELLDAEEADARLQLFESMADSQPSMIQANGGPP